MRISDWSSDVCSSDLLASRRICFADTSPFNGRAHANWHAAYGVGVMDVYGGDRADARALHYFGTRTPCWVVRRIEGGKAMNWTSPAEFFAMGGYGDRKSTRLNSNH